MTNDRRVLAFVILISCFSLPARAAPPGLESLFPAGGQVGTSVACEVAGKGLDKDSPVAWASHPGLVFKAGDKAKKFTVAIAPDVPAGPYLVRFHTAEGSSPPRIFEVGREPEVIEKEPNDAFADAKGQEGRINTVFNGVLEKAGDVDTHAIRVKKGRGVTLEVHGYALGSPMDPALRLLDARGVEIAGGHDTHNLDPRIEYTPKGGSSSRGTAVLPEDSANGTILACVMHLCLILALGHIWPETSLGSHPVERLLSVPLAPCRR